MKDHLKKTWRNKVAALFLLTVGGIALWLDKDITVLALVSAIAFPLIFMSEDMFYGGRK